MKRTTWMILGLLAAATPAFAADHGAKLNELVLSKGGSTTVQYVEIFDTIGNEPYPNAPYKLAVFDVAGTPVGTVNLTLTGAHTKWYIATAAADTAFGTTRDDTLNVVLPTEGQACLLRADNSKISCLAWGCVTTLVQVGEPRTATPPDNMAAQRQANNTYQIGRTTPRSSPAPPRPRARR